MKNNNRIFVAIIGLLVLALILNGIGGYLVYTKMQFKPSVVINGPEEITTSVIGQIYRLESVDTLQGCLRYNLGFYLENVGESQNK